MEVVTVLRYPVEVVIGDITVRDGFQHEEVFVPTQAKVWCLEEMILAGFKRLEVTNFANPKGMPQFIDAEKLFIELRNSKRVAKKLPHVELTAVTITERAADRAIKAKRDGFGPDRILQMVSTSPSYQLKNSGMDHKSYWAMTERVIKKAHDDGMKFCGTVSTIWGCPIEGQTELKTALEFAKRYVDLGADDIEHADRDGSALPNKVYDYFSMILNAIPDPKLHVAHFHVTRGWGSANVLAALQAGITHFEGTMGGIGGQPANFIDGYPVSGIGPYDCPDHNSEGLTSTEDMAVMMDGMGINTGLDLDRVLDIGRMVERILGRRLRSECVKSGRVPKRKD